MRIYGTVKPGPNDYFWVCTICSAMVIDRVRHDQWHEADTASGRTP